MWWRVDAELQTGQDSWIFIAPQKHQIKMIFFFSSWKILMLSLVFRIFLVFPHSKDYFFPVWFKVFFPQYHDTAPPFIWIWAINPPGAANSICVCICRHLKVEGSNRSLVLWKRTPWLNPDLHVYSLKLFLMPASLYFIELKLVN